MSNLDNHFHFKANKYSNLQNKMSKKNRQQITSIKPEYCNFEFGKRKYSQEDVMVNYEF